jgi:3-hydroxyacyl-CoA dehydrogenase
MPRVAVIGAGLIGRSWSIVFARVGWDVALFDAAADAIEPACAMVARGLAELEEHGLIDDAKAAAKRVRISSSLADALDGAGFVQENTAGLQARGIRRSRPTGDTRCDPGLLHLHHRREPLH